MTYDWLSHNAGNPCIVMPTGSGKSLVIAALCRDIICRWPQSKIIVLSHVKELLEQDAEKIRAMYEDFAPMGIYSAGLKAKDLSQQITVAGIQSIYKAAEQLGSIDLCIVDEAHLINAKQAGIYRDFLNKLHAANPAMRIIGLTATPYRLGHGLITGHDGLFNGLVEPVSILGLVADGYLAPLRSKFTANDFDLTGVEKRGGEYVEKQLQEAVNRHDKNIDVAAEIVKFGEGRKSWLVFCTGVKHALAMRDIFRDMGVSCETITGSTPAAERAEIIEKFRKQSIKCLTNANVLTTGFDAPAIDLLAMCRPTMSAALYVQMAGRGMRIADGKKDCLVLDFAGNVGRHGPITRVKPPAYRKGGHGEAPVKICPECCEIVHASERVCPCCGYVFPQQEKTLELHSDEDIMGGSKDVKVLKWFFDKAAARTNGLPMIVCTYITMKKNYREFFCLWHGGYAAKRAEERLKEMTKLDALPDDDHLVEELNKAQSPKQITVIKDGKYDKVIKREF